MNEQIIIDDRDNTAHIIRSKIERRRIKTLFHLLTPFQDFSGEWVNEDRRCGKDRREIAA